MMLAEYLKEHQLKQSEILRQVDYSENQLASLKVVQYPEKLVQLISQATAKSESMIWYELLEFENSEQITKVGHSDDLVDAIEAQHPYIFIPESIRQEQQRLVNSVLTEKDRLGFELGSQGTGNILAEIIYQIGQVFSKDSAEFKRLKGKLRHYYVKVHDESGSLLYEKEQNY